MSEEFTTTVAAKSDTTTAPPISQTIEEGETTSTRTGAAKGYSDTFERSIPEEVLAKIDAFKRVVDEEPVEEVAVADDAAAKVEAAAEAAPVEPAKPADPAPVVAAVPDEVAEYKTRAERLEEANKKLAAEIETARSAAPAMPPHIEKLTKAAESYLDDDHGSLRAFIAHAIGVEDPNSKEVDAELEFQYASLTAKSLGTNLDTSHLALRENARTRQLLARQKRERQVESQTAAEKVKAEAEAKAASTVHEVIGNRLQGKSTEYPLLMSLSETLNGAKPQELLWKVIREGFVTGRFDPKQSDDELTEQAAKLVENRYRTIADKIGTNTKPTTSTVPPSAQAPAASPSSSKDRAPVPARTLTNADASVAPATPPAKPAPKAQPKPMTKEERKQHALRHLPK